MSYCDCGYIGVIKTLSSEHLLVGKITETLAGVIFIVCIVFHKGFSSQPMVNKERVSISYLKKQRPRELFKTKLEERSSADNSWAHPNSLWIGSC